MYSLVIDLWSVDLLASSHFAYRFVLNINLFVCLFTFSLPFADPLIPLTKHSTYYLAIVLEAS